MSSETFLLFKRGLKFYLNKRIPVGHKMLCRDSGFNIKLHCNNCTEFRLDLYRVNGNKYLLSKRYRSSSHSSTANEGIIDTEVMVEGKNDDDDRAEQEGNQTPSFFKKVFTKIFS